MDRHAGTLPMRLKLATRELHTRAERSGVMAELLARRISREAYGALLVNLQAIYVALESMLSTSTLQASGLMPLARTAALTSDVQAFAMNDPMPVEGATLAYVERLHALHGANAHRLWSHVYVRYLGDLHGGQVMSRLVRGLFGVGADGTRFYDFGNDEQVLALRASLRSQLASTALSEVQADEVVAEAVWAFEAHCRLFEQIHVRCG